MAFDLNLPADTTVWGMSSRLVQVTVSPTFTVSSGGEKVKLSIITWTSWAWAPNGSSIAAATRSPAACRCMPRVFVGVISWSSSLGLQRRVDDREPLVALLEVDAGNPEHRTQLGILDLHRTGRGGSA